MGSELCNFLSYWRSLGGGELVPARRLLDLRRLTSILRWMFILEMNSDGSLRFRLAGSSLEEAMGIGMTDRKYADIFDTSKDNGLAEELYALSIVRGCGLLRCGTFTFDGTYYQEFEVLALPFADERAMGGTVMVATVKPFSFENLGFEDHHRDLEICIDNMFLLPSPTVITPDQISDRLSGSLSDQNLDLRVLDVERVLEMNAVGPLPTDTKLPSFTLETAAAFIPEVLN